MRNIVFLALGCLLLPAIVLAQADLQITGFPSKIAELGNSSAQYWATNEGTLNSDPFRLKIWVSIDSVINDEDLHSLSPVFDTLRPNGTRAIHRTRFSLPLPPPFEPSNPGLVGDIRRPLDWIGQPVFSRACIMDADGSTEIVCSTIQTQTATPPQPVTPVASNGTSNEIITLTVELPPEDDGQLLIDSFIARENYVDLNGDSQTNVITFNAQNSELITVEGKRFWRQQLSGRDPGRGYDYGQQYQQCLTTVLGGNVCSGLWNGYSVGNSLDEFAASDSLPFVIDLAWQAFGQTADGGYFIRRCEAGVPESCVEVGASIFDLTFRDSGLERGKPYVYEIEVCDRVFFLEDCNENTRYLIGRTNIGRIALRDEYEDDDIFQQAYVVRSEINQLRSLDSADDEDWIKIILNTAQSISIRTSGETFNDTEITLFDSELAQIGYNNNPEGEETAYAALTTEVLSVGTYYAKINQRFSPLPPLYRPVANYSLDVTLKNLTITPVLQFLLGDDITSDAAPRVQSRNDAKAL